MNKWPHDDTGASDFGGCFNIRNIAGSNNWSNHSWACAHGQKDPMHFEAVSR